MTCLKLDREWEHRLFDFLYPTPNQAQAGEFGIERSLDQQLDKLFGDPVDPADPFDPFDPVDQARFFFHIPWTPGFQPRFTPLSCRLRFRPSVGVR